MADTAIAGSGRCSVTWAGPSASAGWRASGGGGLHPIVVQGSCDLSGLLKLGRVGARRQVSERRVRPVFVVVDPPFVDGLTRLAEVGEQVLVEALVAPSVVSFGKSSLHRLTGAPTADQGVHHEDELPAQVLILREAGKIFS